MSTFVSKPTQLRRPTRRKQKETSIHWPDRVICMRVRKTRRGRCRWMAETLGEEMDHGRFCSRIRESSTKKRGYYRTAKVAERLKISRGRFTIFQEYSACHTTLSRDLWPAKRAKPKAKRNLLKSHQPLVFGQSS